MYWKWHLKAVLPVAAVLVVGIAAFGVAALSLEASQRHRILLVAIGGAVAIFAVLLSVLAILIQRPLIEMKEKVRLLRDGNLDVRVNFSSRNDEIGELGRLFNDMVQQLKESREEIQRLHMMQMSRAEHLAAVGELAAGLAHEIRNPLAGIAGVVEIIRRELPPDNSRQEVLKEVQQEVKHIQNILTDLLSYARPKTSQVAAANLNDTVEHAVQLAKQQILSRPIEIRLQTAPNLPSVEHDAAQIQQVLLNLLLNAIQSIPGEGTIAVAVSSDKGCVVVRVRDTGRGISPEHLSKIFRPFFTTKGHGTGLGLSMARAILEEHGGRIEVTSAVGRGSEFSVWLPFRRPASALASPQIRVR